MKTSHIIIALSLSLSSCFLSSCIDRKQKIDNTIMSVKELPLQSTVVVNEPLWGIEGLVGEKDGNIVCQSSNDSAMFYVLDAKSYSLRKTLGVKGNARNEWIAPHFMFGDDGHVSYVVDNGTTKIHTLKDFRETSQPKPFLKDRDLMNVGQLYHGVVFYVNETPSRIILRLNEFDSNTPIDSVCFEDKTKKGEAYLDEFVYGVNENMLVLAHTLKDKFSVFKLTSDNKLIDVSEVYGKGKTDENEKFYYSSVVFYNHKIYLLSQRYVNIKQETGNSHVEVYDSLGHALENYKLNFMASQMVLNSTTKSLLFLATDGTIRSISIP